MNQPIPLTGAASRLNDQTHLGPLVCENGALVTDLYELTMAASYFKEGMSGEATFSLFVRELPPNRGFLIAAGIQEALDYLSSFRFTDEALEYLDRLSIFDRTFLDYLHGLRFRGDVRGVQEGTAIFPNEPLLEITAPIIQAQIVETAVMNICHLHTVLASKASRVVLAAQGRPVIEFGLRRSPGFHAGQAAARAAYIVGATSTSNVLAGLHDGIPVRGTMAHSYVTAFHSETDAFTSFARSFQGDLVLLIDTYDTLLGARRAIEIARELQSRGGRLYGVRLDSGDLRSLSEDVRGLLDEAGLANVKIMASGGLDEFSIASLLETGAPIDAFGVGTRMTTSADAPYLDMAYKLVRYDNRDVLKLSGGKETWTGKKQVFRMREHGQFAWDLIALEDEASPHPADEALLQPLMRSGRTVHQQIPIDDIRSHCAGQIEAIDPNVRRLRDPMPYRVEFSERLLRLQRTVRDQTRRRELRPPSPRMTRVRP